jgi:hypothetical protein
MDKVYWGIRRPPGDARRRTKMEQALSALWWTGDRKRERERGTDTKKQRKSVSG